ncbi:MAG TPA: hypothetical protein VGY66_10035 [Gemmataceae bacterium]|nr:hypothetical protein [Gemmataceae bacterium]
MAAEVDRALAEPVRGQAGPRMLLFAKPAMRLPGVATSQANRRGTRGSPSRPQAGGAGQLLLDARRRVKLAVVVKLLAKLLRRWLPLRRRSNGRQQCH